MTRQNDPYLLNLEIKLNDKANVEGRRMALMNKPLLLSEFKASFWNWLENTIRQELEILQIQYKPSSAKAIANQTQKVKEEKVPKIAD
ncbi:MAG: hypothetical protein IPI46_08040 [Bacteroidetes bacterium]|nr:hypothetical protein [Bacteroidota bacterium]